MKNLYVAIWFFNILLNSIYSQNKSIHFENITSLQGLSKNSITCILQDKKGFLWFGTYDGLNRYDGYKFTVFKPVIDDSTSISHNFIRALAEDHLGNIWIGTNEGLNKFDKNTEKFSQYFSYPGLPNTLSSNIIRSLCVDIQNNLWIGTEDGGLDKLIIDKGELINYRHLGGKTSISNKIVYAIYQDRSGLLWIGTNDGLKCFDPKTEEFIIFKTDIKKSSSISGNIIRAILEDSSGDLWFGTENDGLNLLLNNSFDFRNPGNVKFISFKFNPKNPFCLSNNNIRALCEISKNEILIATIDGGLDKLIKSVSIEKGKMNDQINEEYRFYNYINEPDNPFSLKNNIILSVYKDREQTVWIGSDGGGLSKFNLNVSKFKWFENNIKNKNSLINDVVKSFYQDKSGNIWIGTRNGLDRFDPLKEGFYHYVYSPKNSIISPLIIFCVTQISDGNLMIGTDGQGILGFDIKNKRFFSPSFLENLDEISKSIITNIHEDKNGKLWIGTWNNGLIKYDIQNKKAVVFSGEKMDSNKISQNVIRSMFVDKDGNIWIGTMGAGLIKVDQKSQKISHFFHNIKNKEGIGSNDIFAINQDKNGVIWIGTGGGGLNRYDPNTQKFYHFTEKEGMPNNVIYGILFDENNNKWISTNKGIVCLNTEKKIIRIYNHLDGLNSNEFNVSACYNLKNGKFLFGSNNGFTLFHPDSINLNREAPKVILTDFLIFNKSVPIGKPFDGKIILEKSISQTKEINLSYLHDVITFEFASVNYFIPEKKSYAYKLENYDKDWNFTDSKERKATYSNLKGGSYIFEVKAINSDGLWSSEGESVIINISTPIWQNSWFLILVILTSLSLLTGINFNRIRGIKLQKKQLEDRVHEKTQEIVNQNKEILKQKSELEIHRNELEKLIRARTIDLELAKRKAEESDRLKTAFLTNMSHEIRTPMNAIIGFSNLLADPYLPESEKYNAINYINSNSSLLLRIIDDIIFIAKIEAGDIQLKETVCKLNSLMFELIEWCDKQKSISGKGAILIKMNIDSRYDKLLVYIDAEKLKQIISTLIENALKYTYQGYIEYGYIIDNEKLRFFVNDTGIGIPEEKMKSVFEKFGKFNNPNFQYRGAGLGLAITKSLVNFMGGVIWVESQEGIGTQFHFTLPLKAFESNSFNDINRKISITPLNWQDRLILIAEDEEINYKLMKASLSVTNSQIIWVKNGKEAIRTFVETPHIDLVLMDMKMPEMNGLEATKEIKRINTKTPVIALTAYAVFGEKEMCLEAGCDDYISKPFTTNDLLNIIKKHLDR